MIPVMVTDQIPEGAVYVTSPSIKLGTDPARTWLVTAADWHEVNRLHRYLSMVDAKRVVAIGGGKVMDVAKLACRLMNTDCEEQLKARQYAGLFHRDRHLTLIPTTLAGSECSRVAVIQFGDRKIPIVHQDLYADAVVLNPALSATTPESVMQLSAWDAISHCIESYVSLLQNAEARGQTRQALPILIGYLKGTATRWEAQGAAHLAGKAQDVASTGLTHAIAHASETVTGRPHVRLCRDWFLSVMDYNAPTCGDAYQQLAAAIGYPLYVDMMSDFHDHMPPADHSWLWELDLEDFAKRVMTDPCARTNPRPVRKSELIQWLESIRDDSL